MISYNSSALGAADPNYDAFQTLSSITETKKAKSKTRSARALEISNLFTIDNSSAIMRIS